MQDRLPGPSQAVGAGVARAEIPPQGEPRYHPRPGRDPPGGGHGWGGRSMGTGPPVGWRSQSVASRYRPVPLIRERAPLDLPAKPRDEARHGWTTHTKNREALGRDRCGARRLGLLGAGGEGCSDGVHCFNGKAFNISFDLGGQHVTLPADVIVSIAFNTTTWGYEPIGAAPCGGNCPYDSLNVGLVSGPPSVGTDPLPDVAYQNTQTAANYADNGA